jgi:branched-chain amino acid aminotransferase
MIRSSLLSSKVFVVNTTTRRPILLRPLALPQHEGVTQLSTVTFDNGIIHRERVGISSSLLHHCSSNSRRSITSSSLSITPHTPTSLSTLNAARPHPTKLLFGQTFSPHMLLIHYENKAWQTPSIVPYGNINISPAASALHYGMECFEGMKAYRALSPSSSSSNNNNNNSINNTEDENVVDDLRLFRPEKNMERLRNSMTRLGMPGTNFNTNEVIECIKELVRLGK